MYKNVEKHAVDAGFKKIIAVSIENAIEFWQKNSFHKVENYSYNKERAYKIYKTIG